VQFGLKVNQHQLTWSELSSRVRLAEDLGFDGAWIFDHFRAQAGDPLGPCMEAWSLLAALAAVTERIRLGALATGVMWRHPSVLAAQAVTIDQVSAGRLEIAMGAAWDQQQHRALGVPFPAIRERAERLEEAAQLMRLLMTADDVDFEGRHFRLAGATYRPRPSQKPHPPIWIAAGGEQLMIPVAARQADVWHCFHELDELPRKIAVFEENVERGGRDPASIRRAANLDISIPPVEYEAHVERLRELGFSEFIVPWPASGRGRIEEFAEHLMWKFR
jgi:alkanesulfonate monooxygenase SsuD/methylene tetrahydromethanopterin reductase-like flavin-dependent oxidoreductase (luciferase family)